MFCRANLAVFCEINSTHIEAVWAARTVFRSVRKISKSDCYLRHVYPSVRLSVGPHGTTLLPPDGFSRNFILQCFSNICGENSSFMKIRQEKRVLYKKTYIYFLSYLAQPLAVCKFKTHFSSVTVFRTYCLL
jgi:hypothetical protein